MTIKAEIICIGTELIIGHTVNTNATYISEILNSWGVNVHYHTAVGDNETRIIECLKLAKSRSDLVITTGGLGPTADDISNETLAKFLGKRMIENKKETQILEAKFHERGIRDIPEINYKQATVIEDGKAIANPIGTALGIFIIKNNVSFITFPGVPIEMKAMLDHSRKLITGETERVTVSRKVHLTDITESRMAQTIQDQYKEAGKTNPFNHANPSLAPYATIGECYLRITAQAGSEKEAKDLIKETDEELHKIFPENIFGYDDATIHGTLAAKLKEKNLKIAFAESCTGGLASKLMTDISGASDYTTTNLVTYSDQAKQDLLGVNTATLEKYGAVSEECAKEMAFGLAKISKADINISITGIAGPEGGTEEKPVGTIYVGIMLPGSKEAIIFEPNLRARRNLTRDQIRILCCKRIFWFLIKNL